MPSLDLGRSLFAAGGTAATDWGQASGAAEVAVRAAAQLKRGIKVDLGAHVIASVDLGLSKFLTAQVSGQAQGQAALTGQVQVPINLFDEVGLAVRLQAIAELSAAVKASVGLSVGDFIELVEQTPEMAGLPAQLFRVFLEEVDVSAGLFAKAALTAQAFAELVVTGTAINDPARNLSPGFNIVAGMGAGLKGGAGFRVFARAGIRDFPRLIARSVDLLVDAAADQIVAVVPDDNSNLAHLVNASRAPCKMALRTAYELGEFLARQDPPRDAAGAQMVALRCAQVILEESQRFLLRAAVEAGLKELEGILKARAGAAAAAWDRELPKRRALADHLARMPPQPFEGTDANLAYWSRTAALGLDLATAMGVDTDPALVDGLSIVWAAGQLAVAATAQVVRAGGSVSIIGLPAQTVHASFTGNLATQPPPPIAAAIRSRIAPLPGGAPLKREHLAAFLADTTVVTAVRRLAPGADAFLGAMVGPLGAAPDDVGKALLLNAGSILRDSSGRLDDTATLRALAGALRAFVHGQVAGVIAPAVRNTLPATADAKMLVDEVLVPSALFAVDTLFEEALRWDTDAAPTDRLTEALSGIVMKVLGRSVVAASDVLLAAVQQQIAGIFNHLADHVGDPGGIVSVFSGNPSANMADEDIAELLAIVLRIGAEVYGPLPADQRQRLRSLMYQAIDPVPAAGGSSFLDQLADDNFVPQGEAIVALAQELGSIGIERFFRLAELLIQRIGIRLLEDLAEFIDEAAQRVVDLAQDAYEALRQLGQRLAELAFEIAALAREVAELFEAAADALLESLATLDTATGRSRLKQGIVDLVLGVASDRLEANDVYRHLVPADVKEAVASSMRSALRSAVDAAVVDVVLDAVGEAASSLDDLVDDVRALDPARPLAPQLLELVLNRIEETAADAFGDEPRLQLRFDASWEYVEPVWVGPAPWDFAMRTRTASVHIDLGHIEIPLGQVLSVVRQVGRGLAELQSAIDRAASDLAKAFAAELDLQQRETERSLLEDERTTLQKRWTEVAPGPRAVAILSPVPMQLVDRAVLLQVSLDGVPESILEEGPDLPARVLVFLNGERVDPSTFSVSTQTAGPGDERADGAARTRPGRADGSSRSRTTNLIPHHVARASVREGTHAGFRTGRPLGAAVSRLGSSGRAHARQVRLERTLARLRNRRPHGGSPDNETGTPLDALSKGGGKGREMGSTLAAVTKVSVYGLGRPLPGAWLEDSAASRRGGLRLTRSLDISELRDGVNALSIVVLDGERRRTESTVSFIAAAAGEPDPADKRPTLPGSGIPRRELPGPIVFAGSRGGLLAPRSRRREASKGAVKALRATSADPLRSVRMVSEALAERLPPPRGSEAPKGSERRADEGTQGPDSREVR